jgi:four helix bundle protein
MEVPMAADSTPYDIAERSFQFAGGVLVLCEALIRRGGTPALLGRQLADAGTSIGANLEEATGGQSKADFIARASIARKEALESKYWLRLVTATVSPVPAGTAALLNESQELVAILTAILKKARMSDRRGA